MQNPAGHLFVGHCPAQFERAEVGGGFVDLHGETYYRIRHFDHMAPFFMSLVSSADHWLFIASTGGLTAGRANAESALFPYETDDKITAHAEQTGSTTIIRTTRGDRTHLWEPFSVRHNGLYRCERNLYKNTYGTALVFEEINHDLQLTYRYAWRTGDRFGFVRSSQLTNDGDEACRIELVDGLRNLLPYGATTQLQTSFSNLLDAYKQNELDPSTGVGVFALSATLTDRAEPSEALQATLAWQTGLDPAAHLLSADQLDAFRQGRPITAEEHVTGRAGAYLVNATLQLPAGATRRWHVVADVNQDSRELANLTRQLRDRSGEIVHEVDADIDRNARALERYVAAADGLQTSADRSTVTHHIANVLFNIMRGGIFAAGYQVDTADLHDFLRVRNRPVLATHAAWFAALPDRIDIRELYDRAATTGAADLVRLCAEYLPLTFSRRHGDPSRPWNQFSINVKQPDGSPRLDYQGNWRDIFQNWEPLAYAFPAYVDGMIAKFLNATTADGYNPYRVTRDGVEWEVPEPDNPWSNIGYWGDHQIIYLLKLLEFADRVYPGAMASLWDDAVFSYADVPYRMKPYEQMLDDWYDTIDFDRDHHEAIRAAVDEMGTDARLCRDASGAVIHATMVEKLLVLLLAKLVNLVPEGGIWMNTQRPEWNDANNALVGKGLSVVTTAYLRRFIAFWQAQLDGADHASTFRVRDVVRDLAAQVGTILTDSRARLDTGFDAASRRAVMDDLGAAATRYRSQVYAEGLTAEVSEVTVDDLRSLLDVAQAHIEHTLRTNRRPDGLYHSYNILRLDEQAATVDHLDPMLEGQVAILSAGMLTPDEALAVLRSLRSSDLYRADQHSYMLYPQRTVTPFSQRNTIAAAQVADSALVEALTANDDERLLVRDDAGDHHFNGSFRNAKDVARVLAALEQEDAYAQLVTAERTFVLDLFEATFEHRSFTGRSGTFFAFEGLGSIYWHMVSKLLLAVQENYLAAVAADADEEVTAALAEAYYDVRGGLGFNKSPDVYGAFPTDPYSHTPADGGASQPGMTGQVKEEILTRLGELGVTIDQATLAFRPTLLRPAEFRDEPSSFTYIDVGGEHQTVSLPPGSLAFTYCQTPIVYTRGDAARITVTTADGEQQVTPGDGLDAETSRNVFDRDGHVRSVQILLHASQLQKRGIR